MRLTGHRSCRQGLSVRLFLTDLDNTLVDRSDAFRRWACGFVAELGLPIEEVDNIEAIDAGGTIPRGELFATLVAHYGLLEPADVLRARYRQEFPRSVRCFPGVKAALANGDDAQLEKLSAAGLHALVSRCCASDLVGSAKPDSAIFYAAAERCGLDLVGGWMVGDDPVKDIAGATGLGLDTAWLSHGRSWPTELLPPTIAASSFSDAVDRILRRNQLAG